MKTIVSKAVKVLTPPPSTPLRKAFTLAEVLITLGIIGIVAAMTIPTLILNFQEKVLINQFKKSYSMLNQALTITNYENGTDYMCYTKQYDIAKDGYWVYSQCDDFFESFLSHLNIQKSEEHKTGWLYKSPSEVRASGGGTSNNACSFSPNYTIKYYLKNGSTLYRNTNRPTSNVLEVYIILDVNGDKGPNKWGYDAFYLTPIKKANGSFRINEAVCAIWEKGGKRVFNIINDTEEVTREVFPD